MGGQFTKALTDELIVRTPSLIAHRGMIHLEQLADVPLTEPVLSGGAASPWLVALQASDVFPYDVFERGIIQDRLGQQLLQPPVLVLEPLKLLSMHQRLP